MAERRQIELLNPEDTHTGMRAQCFDAFSKIGDELSEVKSTQAVQGNDIKYIKSSLEDIKGLIEKKIGSPPALWNILWSLIAACGGAMLVYLGLK